MMKIEAITFPWLRDRPHARRILRNTIRGAQANGHLGEVRSDPTGKADVLVLWGIGHPKVMQTIFKSKLYKANIVSWDLGYWDRDHKYRVSINDFHPDRIVMLHDRPDTRHVPELREEGDPNGPILLVGMGWKSARMYGEAVGHWEQIQATVLRDEFPNKVIKFRPKPGSEKHCQKLDGLPTETRPIEEALKGTSLVVCRHSNVAIDALIAGVPFRTEGGAARVLSEADQKNEKTRRQFLINLSWFQWSIEEMAQPETWKVIEGMIEDAKTVQIS